MSTLIVLEGSVPASAVVEAVTLLGLPADRARVVAGPAGLADEAGGSAATAVALAPSLGAPTLAALLRVLRPDGSLVVPPCSPAAQDAGLVPALLLAGFVNAAPTAGGGAAACKPAWAAGASLSLRKQPAPAPAPPAWRVTADDDVGDDDGALVDEEALLTEADRAPPPPPAPGAAPRSACANCTCGRAATEAAAAAATASAAAAPVKLSGGTAEAALPPSACGSCYLGDAYRCAGCPYLGKPAFEQGAGGKVVLLTAGADE